jgi:DNA polymerase (family 10)
VTLRRRWRLRGELATLPGTLAVLGELALLRGEQGLARELADAASVLSQLSGPSRTRFALDALEPRDTPHPHLSAAALDTLRRAVDEGRTAVEAAARARLAPDLLRLLDVPGITLEDVVAVHRRSGAVTAGDLAAAVLALSHPVVDLDDTLRGRLAAALPSLRSRSTRMPLGRAVSLVERVTATLRERLPDLLAVEPVGSVRRFEPTVGDVEVLVAAQEPAAAIGAIEQALAAPTVLFRGPHLLSGVLDGEPLTVRAVSPDEWPFALLYYTGSAAHVHQLRAHATRQGLQLGQSALTVRTGERLEGLGSEADVYARLGLPFVPPERRHGEDELTAGAAQAPALVTVADIRGDLHTHTLWSDGRDSVETVVRTARALGYEYVAITDHSGRAAVSRALTEERLERQRDDVESARRRVPGITVLHGAEVEILPDGSLDYADDVLERLDIVLASLHEACGQAPDVLLERYLMAMRHPHVHVVTHPANRIVGGDEGYALDYDRLFAAAVETGTVLEIDGGPGHLDLDGHLARRAVAAGAVLAIDSDSHVAARMGRQMQLGVGTARRGAVAAHHVLNTRPLADVLAHFAGKPARLARLQGTATHGNSA